MTAFRFRRLLSLAATGLFVATSTVAFNACGSPAGTSAVPSLQQQSSGRHVKDTSQFPQAPPTPVVIPPFIDQNGGPCDPSALVVITMPDGTQKMQQCGVNPAYDTTGVTQNPAHGGIDLSNYQPQCTDIYGSLMNSASFHQCYKLRMWIN
jgi:hypothetical protein